MSAIAQVEPMTTARALRGPFDYRLPEELRADVDVGSMLVVPFGRRKILGVVTGLLDRSEVSEEKLLAPLRALEFGVPVDLVVLAQWLAREYCSTLSRALGLVLPPAATRRLSGRKARVHKRAEHLRVGAVGPAPQLTAEQADAVDDLSRALALEGSSMGLLAGVTGSGKTEVYLQVAAEALSQGRGAIVLVPEIGLTPQMVARFAERFGDTVAVLHSRLTVAQRREEWRRLRVGEARLCIGPRSAVFAPIERLGLIVLDEEHDPSYKHEGDPRYDARTVAARRAHDCSALLLLGSATPRPESVEAAAVGLMADPGGDAGAGVGVLRLSHRVGGGPLPRVDVLDMRDHAYGLHPLSAQALAEVKARRGKAIVLLNRRGWSNFLTCRSCGAVWTCPQCDVALVLHRAQGTVACHHCGHRESAPRRCACGSTSVARHGAGTERVQHELASALEDGDFPVFRLDADTAVQTAAAHGGVGALLSGFERARAGVLIGTQMVAKGHDFPDVSLGVVLDADATLRFPDFRAEERTFALVAQLAGRVGRGESSPPARVLVQTMAPRARSIVHAALHDSDGFLAGELQRRKALSYPPYASLIRIVCAAESAERTRVAAQELFAHLRSGVPAGTALLGPAALFRVRGRERQAIVVKAIVAERSVVVAQVGEAVQRIAAERAHAGVALSVDVDPQ
ncbi:MAG TPA: primosomal protein N' [Solirubrobacteraceae bacterium]|nr:primosomal protein N' [Solirubrobacteraceae bacterium]